MELVLGLDDPTDEQLDLFTEIIGETPYGNLNCEIVAGGYWRIRSMTLRDDRRYDACIERLGEGISSTDYDSLAEFREAMTNFVPTVVNVINVTGRLGNDSFIVSL